jgi:hypothetical protein
MLNDKEVFKDGVTLITAIRSGHLNGILLTLKHENKDKKVID